MVYPGYTMKTLLNEPLVLIEYLYRMSEWKAEFDAYNTMFIELAKSSPR